MKTYTSNVFAAGGRFEYEILQDGVRSIHQDYDPDQPGQTSMDEATATTKAAAVVRRLHNADMLPLLQLQLVGAIKALDTAKSDSLLYGNPDEAEALVSMAQGAVNNITAAIAAAQPA